MKKYTVADINNHDPCYDPERYLDPTKEYTLLDFLDHKRCPSDDIIWVVTRFLSRNENRLLSAWAVREVLSHEPPNAILLEACKASESFAKGEIELSESKKIFRRAFREDYYSSPSKNAYIMLIDQYDDEYESYKMGYMSVYRAARINKNNYEIVFKRAINKVKELLEGEKK